MGAHTKSWKITLRISHCKQCDICVAFCSKTVFSTDSQGYPEVTAAEACTGCMLCVYLCPDFALDVEEA